MYNGLVIRNLLKRGNFRNKELLSYMGWSTNSQLKNVVEGNPSVKTLERIADFFDVSMDLFFERHNEYKFGSTVMGNSNNVNSYVIGDASLKERVNGLENIIKEKDKYIDALESIRKILEQKLDNK